MELKKAEDFQRVVEALADPKAQAWKYRVQEYGYCLKCPGIAPVFVDAGPDGVGTLCLCCGSGQRWGDRRVVRAVLLGSDAPANVQGRLAALHGREHQRDLLGTQIVHFRNRLLDRHGALEQEMERVSEEIRKAANLAARLKDLTLATPPGEPGEEKQ